MPQDKKQQSSAGGRQSSLGSRQSSDLSGQAPRDNQQIQDDNQTSGESVVAGQSSGDAQQPTAIGRGQDTPNQAANKETAEGSRENAGGISNRPLDEEVQNQERVPSRGDSKDGSHA
jgi:hypothetical protein